MPAKKLMPVKSKSVDIVNENGDIVRSYSQEVHGDNFLKMAKEFAGQYPSYTIK